MNKFISVVVAGLAAATVSQAALADGGAKFLGNITTSSQIRADMGTYWNQITNENGCKWGTIHSVDANGKSKFNFNGFDSCENGYKWAKEKPGERFFKFHALIWGSQKPDFLCTKKNPGITVEKTKQYITEWFDAVAAKFPDLEYIDVVNEAIWAGDNYHSGYNKPAAGAEGNSTDDPTCGGTYIIDALGGDQVINGKHQYNFITKAFQMARERWPKATLIYNDYNTLSWQMNEGIELVQTILKNGAPVDAYGQQSHDCKGMSKADFESKLTRIHNEVGIPLVISEYDIGEADDNKQKNDYANQIPFMWETPWIGGITIWGYINGATWAANTGIMEKDGRKRAAMVWLEDYFAKNLDKGQNTTGFGGGTPIEPVPQEPYGGKPWAIPGKIEAENFDVPGVGKGNESYSDTDAGNNACKEDNANLAADCKKNYREDVDVDIKTSGTGYVIGWGATDEWLEYTVDVAEAGTYTVFVAASSGGGGIYKLSLVNEDGTLSDLTKEIEVSAAADENDFNSFEKNGVNVNFKNAGKQIVRFTIVKGYVDFDYMTFVAGADATDPEPIEKPGEGSGVEDPSAIAQNVQLNVPTLGDYDVFDMQGVFIGRVSGYSFDQAISYVKNGNVKMAKGVYTIRSRSNGMTQNFKIAK